MVMQKSVTKNLILQSMEGKKIGQTHVHGRIRRRRLVLNPMIQQFVIPNMTILSSMVVEKSLMKNFTKKGKDKKDGLTGQTDRGTDGKTDGNQYTAHFFKVGVKKS